MALIDGDELRAEAETDNGDVDLALAHDAAPLLRLYIRPAQGRARAFGALWDLLRCVV
jgi:hypothetical protein